MNNLELLIKFYLFFCFIAVILSISLYAYTNKFKKDKVRIFGLFLDLDKRDCLLLGCNLLSLIVTIYSLIEINNFNIVIISMLLTISLIALLISLNFHIILSEIVYTSTTLIVLKLLNLTNSFLQNVSFDTLTYILSIVFMLAIAVYSLFIFVRKTELLLRNNKYIRRMEQ